MSTGDADHLAATARGRRAGCLERAALIVVLAAAAGYFVAWPIAKRAVEGFGAAAETVLQGALEGLSAAVVEQYDEARTRVEQDPHCQLLFGEPVTCPPPDEATWLAGSDNRSFEFTFAVEGPKGRGSAHAYATAAEERLQISRLEVTGPDGDVVALPSP